MKRFILLICLAFPAFAQSTIPVPVVGNINTVSGVPAGPNNYIEFTLVNCGSTQATVNGVAVMLNSPVDFYQGPNSTLTLQDGATPATLYGNDIIACGSIGNTSRYQEQQFVNSQPAGNAKFYFIQSGSGLQFNINTAQPISVLPPLKYPNPNACAAGTTQTGLNNDLSPICTNLPSGASNAVVTNPAGQQNVAQPTGTKLNVQGILQTVSGIDKGPKVNVLHSDFGIGCSNAADPTGVLPSACAINKALAFVMSSQQTNSSIACLEIPNGTFLLETEIRVPAGAHICGHGPNQTFLKIQNQWQNALTLLNGVAPGAPGGQDNFTYLEGFTITGNGHLTSGTAIEFLSADRGVIKDVNISNHGGRGFNMWGDSERWNMIDVRFSRVRWPLSTNFQTNEDHWFGLHIDDAGDTDDGFVYNRNAVNGVLPTPNSQAPVAATWTANTQFHGGDFINDGTTNCSGGPCNQRAAQDLVSGATIPAFTGGDGTLTNDGTTPLNGQWLNVSNRTFWLPDYHCAAVFNGNDNDVFGASIKPNRSLCAVQWGGTNGELHDMYFEGAFGGSPLVNAAVEAGGFAERLTLTSSITTTATTIPISDTSWIPNFLTNLSDANGSIGVNSRYGFHIMCADAKPGSTTACAAHSSIQQGQSEFISCGVASQDGSLHQCQRCAAGSSIGCTSGTGFAWSTNDIVTFPNSGSPTGVVTVYNSHYTTPFNPTNSTGYIAACNQNQVGGHTCGTVIVGGVIDGLELTRPNTDPQGFSGSPRQGIVLQDNVFNAGLEVTDGIRLIAIPFSGDATWRNAADAAPNFPVDSNSIMYAANGQPVQYKGKNYGVYFGQYSGGNATGSFADPEDGVWFSPNQNFFISAFRATNSTETLPGQSVNPGYCQYDIALKGASTTHPNSRWCFHSGTSTSAAFVSMDTWDGVSKWVQGPFLNFANGLQQSTATGVNLGISSNLVQHSINISNGFGGWTAIGTSPTVTTGQADPFGGNNATLVAFPAASSTGFDNLATVTLTTGITNTACVWMRGASGGETVNWGVISTGSTLPPTISTLPASWVRFSESSTNISTGHPFRIGASVTTGESILIYNPQVQVGSSCGPDFVTQGSITTPTSSISAQDGQFSALGDANNSTGLAGQIPVALGPGGSGTGRTWTWQNSTVASHTMSGPGCSVGAGAIGNSCTAIITNSPTFADAGYQVSGCSIVGATGGAATVGIVSTPSIGGQFPVQEVGLSTTATTGGTIYCTVTHP